MEKLIEKFMEELMKNHYRKLNIGNQNNKKEKK